MKPWDHQVSLATEGYKILKTNGLVYLAMEERTGKSLTALLIAEHAIVAKVLIITKKKALEGWLDLLSKHKGTRYYHATNYHSVHKLEDDWDLIIIDEAHNYISSFPKKSKLWVQVRRLTRDKPIIYLSATPHAQTRGQLYNQLALSDWSPWKGCTDYKSWHRNYGVEHLKYIHAMQRSIEQWDHVDDARVAARVEHLFITKTRKELGFKHEPKDQVHYVQLSDKTKELYNKLLKNKIYQVDNVTIACESGMKLRTSLHMLEGGAAKSTRPKAVNGALVLDNEGEPRMEDVYHVLENSEKIQYILDNWGDSSSVVIMYNYIAEGTKLKDTFKHANILQATSNAEGVDLAGYEHLIVYSQDFSTARHTQRRARQANLHRSSVINVHFLLVKNGVSDEVYTTVSLNKQNYVDSLFNKQELQCNY